MEDSTFLSLLISPVIVMSTLRGAAPLIYAAMAGLMSERAGIIQIALEGFMLIGALTAAIVAHYTGNPWLGFISGALGGLLLALIKAFFVLKIRADQIITGTAVNILAIGVAPFITKIFFNSTGSTPPLDESAHFTFAPIVLAFAVGVFIMYWQKYSRAALWVNFAGEEPSALLASGHSVDKIRLISLSLCGLLVGLGGATLSLCLSSNYSPNMTAGRGFMALAALIVGQWRAGPAIIACLIFSFTDAIQIRLQGADTGIPVQFIQILPYIITIVALAGFFGKSRAPKALGKHV